MGTIVCATRGGEASRRTQERAIALAQERGAELIFLCVVDPNFAGPLNEVMGELLRDELQRLSKSLLAIAQARAQDQGVRSTAICRSGEVWKTIEEFLREVGAETLVIGAPETDGAPHLSDRGEMGKTIRQIEQHTGARIVIVT